MSNLIYAAKATSTVCLLWSAYVFARTRVWRKRKNNNNNNTVLCQQIPSEQTSEHSSDHLSDTNTANNASEVNTRLLELNDYPINQTIDSDKNDHSNNSSNNPVSIYQKTVQRLCNILYSAKQSNTDVSGSTKATPGDKSAPSVFSTASMEDKYSLELHTMAKIISDLGDKAGLSSQLRTRRFSRFHKTDKITPDSVIQMLIDFSKDSSFLDKSLNTKGLQYVISWLAKLTLRLTIEDQSNNNGSTIDQLPCSSNPTVSDLMLDVGSQMNSTIIKQTKSSTSDKDNNYNSSNFSSCLCFALLLANLTRHSSSYFLTQIEDVAKLIELWKRSPSSRLNIMALKIEHNLWVHSENLSNQQLIETDPEIAHLPNFSSAKNQSSTPVYFPDIYRLDVPSNSSKDYDFDIVFVNGMLGSVFHTWRQHDSMLLTKGKELQANGCTYTHCWPRDWLANEFPNARIIGVDTSLKPFVWNRLCPNQKLRRTLDSRALDIMKQLSFARVGDKPIIWITHSAGGILVKEMLRLATSKYPSNADTQLIPNKSFSNDSGQQVDYINADEDADAFDDDYYNQLTINALSSSPSPSRSNRPRWYCEGESDINTDESMNTTHIADLNERIKLRNSFSVIDSSTHGDDHDYHQFNIGVGDGNEIVNDYNNDSNQSGLPSSSSASSLNHNGYYSQLSNQTKEIVFISTPHRGNQSLFALYRRPFRWILTPEAIQLERNCEYLIDLHNWFNKWAKSHAVQIFSLVETRVTAVNRFWSVLLVPEDENDREIGELIRVDADHLDISKPKTVDDPVYKNIVRCIHQQVDQLIQSTIS